MRTWFDWEKFQNRDMVRKYNEQELLLVSFMTSIMIILRDSPLQLEIDLTGGGRVRLEF